MATAQESARFYQPRRHDVREVALAWLMIAVVCADVVIFGIVGLNAYFVRKESQEVFALLRLQAGECRANYAPYGPTRYDQTAWKISFELPGGYVATEERLSDDGDVEFRVARRPETVDPLATLSIFPDTSVRLWIGQPTGFSRYLTRPFTTYGGYRRFTAVGRSAVTYADPERGLQAGQVIVIDDTRNEREIRISYSPLMENAEPLAYDIMKSLRLAPRENLAAVVKPGWKVFSQEPIRFQYPEDYRVETPILGKVIVKGAGGRIELTFAADLDESGRRKLATTPSDTSTGGPDEYFDLQYDVDVRASFYYGTGSSAYDRGILKEIASTIALIQ